MKDSIAIWLFSDNAIPMSVCANLVCEVLYVVCLIKHKQKFLLHTDITLYLHLCSLRVLAITINNRNLPYLVCTSRLTTEIRTCMMHNLRKTRSYRWRTRHNSRTCRNYDCSMEHSWMQTYRPVSSVKDEPKWIVSYRRCCIRNKNGESLATTGVLRLRIEVGMVDFKDDYLFYSMACSVS